MWESEGLTYKQPVTDQIHIIYPENYYKPISARAMVHLNSIRTKISPQLFLQSTCQQSTHLAVQLVIGKI